MENAVASAFSMQKSIGYFDESARDILCRCRGADLIRDNFKLHIDGVHHIVGLVRFVAVSAVENIIGGKVD